MDKKFRTPKKQMPVKHLLFDVALFPSIFDQK